MQYSPELPVAPRPAETRLGCMEILGILLVLVWYAAVPLVAAAD